MSEITTSPKKRNRGYIEGYKPHKKTLALIDTAKAVLDEYEDYWPLTRCGRSCARSRFYSWHAIPQHRKTKAITFTVGADIGTASGAAVGSQEALERLRG